MTGGRYVFIQELVVVFQAHCRQLHLGQFGMRGQIQTGSLLEGGEKLLFQPQPDGVHPRAASLKTKLGRLGNRRGAEALMQP